jgi:Kef-type K+ transport system membrane component KefB
MLARIIVERGLSGTRFGSLALACGGIDDMAAWILLAGVLSLASAKLWPFTKALGGAVVFAAVLVLVIRPLLDRYLRRPGLSPQTVLLITMVVTLAAAWFTTDIGPRVLLFSVAAIVVAVLSKGGACWLGARLAGEPGSVAARIGTLMNARGLMQLIALNIGLQAGIASQDLFTSLVLVALVTTIMTAPVLSWIERREVKTVAVTRMSPELGQVTG